MVAWTTGLLLWCGKKDAAWSIHLFPKEKRLLLFVSLILEGLNLWCCQRKPVYWILGGAVFAGCLLTACVMDLAEHMVYRYVWIVCGIVEICWVLTESLVIRTEQWISWLFFVGLQQILFARMYGRADCHAFCICGVRWILEGGGFELCVIHMAVSFGLLTMVQIFRGNVSGKGKLKQAVPMLPYITVGFWICMIWMNMG